MGCLCTYASYFSRQTHLTKSALQIVSIDTVIAILAGLMLFVMAFMTVPALCTKKLRRYQGIVLLIIYAAYVCFQFFF